WDIKTRGHGKEIEAFIVDGVKSKGTYKIPKKFYRSGRHTLEIHYGKQRNPRIIITEIRGGELTSIETSDNDVRAAVNCFGSSTLVFTSPDKPSVHVDGKDTQISWNEARHSGIAEILAPGKHVVALERL
ncbi:MAG: hypothetical protein AABZ61_13765, partial [Bacteroidota bacterium]